MTVFSWASAISILSLATRNLSQRMQQHSNSGVLSNAIYSESAQEASSKIAKTRRDALASLFILSSSVIPLINQPQVSQAYDVFKVVRIANPQQRLGIELTEVTVGNPSRSVVAVKSVDPFGLAARQNIEPGLVLSDFSTPKALIERIQSGPYPLDLKFVNLAAGGDAFGDMGKPLVSAEDALSLAKQNSDDSGSPSDGDSINYGYRTTVLHKPSQEKIKSRRGDVLEIQYTASYYLDGERKKLVYDSSAQRGTGLPYQFVLGSGDMVPGVDLGLYDMYPGEIRALDVPKQLGYGERGNKLFRIPGGARLYWTVELVAVNTVREGDDRTREDMNY